MRQKTVELCLRVAASSGFYCYSWNAVVALANTLEEALAIACSSSDVAVTHSITIQQRHSLLVRCHSVHTSAQHMKRATVPSQRVQNTLLLQRLITRKCLAGAVCPAAAVLDDRRLSNAV